MADKNGLQSVGRDGWGDEYFRDEQGREVNENRQETNWSKEQRAIAQQQAKRQAALDAEAARRAQAARAAEKKMVLDEVDRQGGILAALMGRPSAGRSISRELLRPLNGWESFLIKAFAVFMIGYVAVYALYYSVIVPVTRSVRSGIRSVKEFFAGVVEGIKNVIAWIWDKIVWVFKAWIDNIQALFARYPGVGFLKKLFYRLFILFELFFVALLLFDLYKRLRGKTRPLYFTALDAYFPAIVLLIVELLTWLFFRPMSFPATLYNTVCLSFWVILAEYVLIKVFQKKEIKA